MPYITPEDRERLKLPLAKSPGDLNYLVTEAVQTFIRLNGKNYTTFNAAIGALECAKQELYRRVIIPYEDQKIKENGDVYTVQTCRK